MTAPAQKCARCDTLVNHLRGDLCAACVADDLDLDPDEDWGFGDEYEDCGMMPDGQCLKAGSEECDWECGRLR